MNSKSIVATIIVSSILMTGCKTPPTRDELATANYGPKVSQAQMVSFVKSYMSSRLIDPSSATYRCNTPHKAWIKAGSRGEGNATFNSTYYGYFSTCLINGKNRLGGYTGSKEFSFMIYQHGNSSAIVHFDGFLAGGTVKE